MQTKGFFALLNGALGGFGYNCRYSPGKFGYGWFCLHVDIKEHKRCISEANL